MENVPPLDGIEQKEVLSEADCWDILFWSFQYSQGDAEVQRKILNYVRRTYDLAPSFVARYSHDPSYPPVEDDPYARRGDDMAVPAAQMQRFSNHLQGEHKRNTKGKGVDPRGIRRNINLVIAEFVRPAAFAHLSTESLVERILAGMAHKDYVNIVVEEKRTNSFTFHYLRDGAGGPGGKPLQEMLSAIRAAYHEAWPDRADEIVVYEASPIGPANSLKTILDAVQAKIDSLQS